MYNELMHLLSRPTINSAIARHPDSAKWLNAWWNRAGKSRWESLQQVRGDYSSVDQVDCCLVFNVKGNSYRLICRVCYANQWSRGTLLIKQFLTHAEYDKNAWRKDCE